MNRKIASHCNTFHLCCAFSYRFRWGISHSSVILSLCSNLSRYPDSQPCISLAKCLSSLFSILGRTGKPTFRQITASPAFPKMLKHKCYDLAFVEARESSLILVDQNVLERWSEYSDTITTVTISFLPFHSFSKEQ